MLQKQYMKFIQYSQTTSIGTASSLWTAGSKRVSLAWLAACLTSWCRPRFASRVEHSTAIHESFRCSKCGDAGEAAITVLFPFFFGVTASFLDRSFQSSVVQRPERPVSFGAWWWRAGSLCCGRLPVCRCCTRGSRYRSRAGILMENYTVSLGAMDHTTLWRDSLAFCVRPMEQEASSCGSDSL